jgi:hypothetical protein
MLSTISSRAWIQGSMPYCVPKDGTPGSEYSFPNQEVNTASESRSKCTESLDLHRIPTSFPRGVVICVKSGRGGGGGAMRGNIQTFGVNT